MIKINYLLQGFGFKDSRDFLHSTFGHTFSILFVKMDIVFSFLFSSIHFLFGFNHLFLTAYVILLVFEWITGVQASRKRGEKHESRKFGRMLLKIATYLIPIYILHTFSDNVEFPRVGDFEFDPFHWLYWVVLIAIIWQLMVSLLENLDSLGIKYARVLMRIINKKFYKTFDLEEQPLQPLHSKKIDRGESILPIGSGIDSPLVDNIKVEDDINNWDSSGRWDYDSSDCGDSGNCGCYIGSEE